MSGPTDLASIEPMSHRSAILLRYRFRTPAQLGRHLRVAEGRTLLFYRSPRVELRSGDLVVLEIAFDASEARLLLRGAVLSLSGGTNPGAWLEFPDARLAGGKLEGIALAPRKQRRLGCEAMVQIVQNDNRAIGKIVDVSMGGARIASAGNLKSDVAVRLKVLSNDPGWPAELGLAQIVRTDQDGTSVRFLRQDPETRLAAMKLFNAVQEAWAKASEESHPPVCCENGSNLDPSPPALAALQKRHEAN